MGLFIHFSVCRKRHPAVTQHPPGVGKAQVFFPPLSSLSSPPSPPSFPSTSPLVTSTPSSSPYMLWHPIIALIRPSILSLLFLLPLFLIYSFVLHDLSPVSLHTSFTVFILQSCCRPLDNPSQNETTILSNDVFLQTESVHCTRSVNLYYMQFFKSGYLDIQSV